LTIPCLHEFIPHAIIIFPRERCHIGARSAQFPRRCRTIYCASAPRPPQNHKSHFLQTQPVTDIHLTHIRRFRLGIRLASEMISKLSKCGCRCRRQRGVVGMHKSLRFALLSHD
jgi:hypothetical protein